MFKLNHCFKHFEKFIKTIKLYFFQNKIFFNINLPLYQLMFDTIEIQEFVKVNVKSFNTN